MKKSLFLTGIVILFFQLNVSAQVGSPGNFEKYEFQPGTWEVPDYGMGEADNRGNLTLTMPIASVTNSVGLFFDFKLNYSSDIRYTDAAGWVGLGWSSNPGTINRSVQGAFIAEDLTGSSDPNIYFKSQPVDFPSNLKKKCWDGIKDVYSLTLPDGRSTRFIIKDINPGDNESVHSFISLSGEPWKIEGFFTPGDSSQNLSQCKAYNLTVDYRTCFSEPVQDYHTFVITDENGVRYIFREPTRELSFGKNGRKSVYFSTWRISVIAPAFSAPITDYNNINLPFDQIVRYYYESSFNEWIDNPESPSHCKGHLIEYDIINEVKYLTKVEAGYQRLTLDLIKDEDIDLQGYLQYSFNLNTDVFYQLMQQRKRIKEVRVERKYGSSWIENFSVIFSYQNFHSHSFLTSVKKVRNNVLIEPQTDLEYFIPAGTSSFAFDFLSYWNATREKYTPFNCNFDINGYYKDSKKFYYRHNLPEVGQLRKISYPTGRKDEFSYSHENFSLPDILSFPCFFVDNSRLTHVGKINVNTSLYFPAEQRPDSTQSDYDIFIGRVVRGPVPTSYWSKSVLSDIKTLGSDGEDVHSKSFYFEIPVLVGFPRMLEFNDVNAMDFIDLKNSSVTKKPFTYLDKASKSSAIEDQVSFGKILQYERNGNPISKMLPTRKQDFYFIVSPYGTNKAKPVIWAGNAHDFNPEPFFITDFYDETVYSSYKITGSVNPINTNPLLNIPGWSLGKYFQDQTIKIGVTNTRKYHKSNEEVIESQEFYSYMEKGIKNASATFIGYDEIQDSSTYKVILDKKGSSIYNELQIRHDFQSSIQVLTAFVKLKGKPEYISQFPWSEVKNRLLSVFTRLPSGGSISVTTNKIDFYSFFNNQLFSKSRQYSSLKPDQSAWTEWLDGSKTPMSQDWFLDVENLSYSAAGILQKAQFPEFSAEFYYGNSENIWSNSPGFDFWGKPTATRLISIDKKDTFDFTARYDKFGNMFETTQLNGKMNFTYDNCNRLIETRVNGKKISKNTYLMNSLVQTGSGSNLPHLNIIRKMVYSDADSVFSDHFHNGFWTVQNRTGGRSGVVSAEPFRNLQGREIGKYPPYYELQSKDFQIKYNDYYTGRSGFIPYSYVDKEFQLNNMSDINSWKNNERGEVYSFDGDSEEISSFSVPYKHVQTNISSYYSFPAGSTLSKLKKFGKSYSYIRDGKRFNFSVDEDGKISYKINSLDDLILETGQIDSSVTSITENPVRLRYDPQTQNSGSNQLLKAAGFYYFNVRPGDMLRIKPFKLDTNKKLILTNEESSINEIKINGPANIKQQDILLLPGVYKIDYLALGDELVVDSILVPLKFFPILNCKKLQQVVYSYDRYRRLISVKHPDESVTRYSYDERGFVVKKETPYQMAKIENLLKPESDLDENPDYKFVYDKQGRLRFSINPNQSESGKMSYQKYDFWGRPIESGEMNSTGVMTQTNADSPGFPTAPAGVTLYSVSELSVKPQKIELGKDVNKIIPSTRIYYDKAPQVAGFISKNAKGKQAGKIDYVKSPAGNWFPVKSVISYDHLGRPDFVYQVSETGTLTDSLSYTVSNQIKYQITRLNNKFFKETSSIWSSAGLVLTSYSRIDSTKPPELLSQNEYYPNGLLSSEKIGNNLIDVNYDFDARGWLEELSFKESSNQKLLFKENLGYFNYAGNTFKTTSPESYTGNITWSSNDIVGIDQIQTDIKFAYEYDLQNRLTKAVEVNQSGVELGKYNSDYSYDNMGNMITQNKKAWDEAAKKTTDLDMLLYQYSGSRLLNVIDRVKTTRSDDYETTLNTVSGSPLLESKVMASFLENFNSYTVKSGRPGSTEWKENNGFYQTGDPESAVSIRTETGNQFLCLAPIGPNTNSSLVGKNKEVIGGRQFRLAGRYKGTSYFDGEIQRKSQCFAGVEWLSNDGARISVKYILSNGYKTTWTAFSGTLTAPLNAVSARILLINFDSPFTEGHFDDILFEEAGLSFAYDANGNLIKDLNRGIKSIQNNTVNLPESVEFENGKKISYGYSSDGARIWKKGDFGVVWYLRGFNGSTVAEFSVSTTVPDYITIHTQSGEVKGQYRLESGIWKKYFYVQDHIGNIRQTLKDEGGSVKIVSTEDFYPFGATMRSKTTLQPVFDKFKYQGKERDQETGYDYFEARMYDSQLGRFMQVDPLAEKFRDSNPFVGMGNNPILAIDPTGMDTVYYRQDGTEDKEKRKKADGDDVVYGKNDEKSDYKQLDGDPDIWKKYMEAIRNSQIKFNDNVSRFDIDPNALDWLLQGIGSDINIVITQIRGNSSHKDNNQAIDLKPQNYNYFENPRNSIEIMSTLMFNTILNNLQMKLLYSSSNINGQLIFCRWMWDSRNKQNYGIKVGSNMNSPAYPNLQDVHRNHLHMKFYSKR